ncbi:MAG: hypothetical protein LBH38_00060 [Holosporales bacterium]|nr:hypothetical protein [Holosporales bacterium]
MHSSLPILTKMGCVLYWLRHEGIDIKCWKHTNREVFYTLEKRTLSRCQVVLMANYHRLKKGLPLFWVDNLTVG